MYSDHSHFLTLPGLLPQPCDLFPPKKKEEEGGEEGEKGEGRESGKDGEEEERPIFGCHILTGAWPNFWWPAP